MVSYLGGRLLWVVIDILAFMGKDINLGTVEVGEGLLGGVLLLPDYLGACLEFVGMLQEFLVG